MMMMDSLNNINTGKNNNNNGSSMMKKPVNSADASSAKIKLSTIDCKHHRVIFVEVKSPSDVLSNKQRVVNDLLMSLGFCVHVCRVNEKKDGQ